MKGRTPNGNTLLHMCAENSWTEGTNIFLDIANWREEWLNVKGENDRTPLMLASWNGHLNTVKQLVSMGAKTEDESDIKSTALLFACNGGHLDVVEYLISKGANIDATDTFLLH